MYQALNPDFPGKGGRRSSHFSPRLPRLGLLPGVLPAVLPALLGMALALPAAGQTGPVTILVSTSGNVSQAGSVPAVDDASLVRIQSGSDARVQFLPGHWQGVSGRVPGDIDGLARRPGMSADSHRGLAFTLQADQAGFLDGDVLGLAFGGDFEVLVFESDLQLALGVVGTQIDLDAIAFDDQDRLLFSLQGNLADSVLGPISDGDVLRLDAGSIVTRMFTEADVQAKVSSATGSISAIGDVLGLDFVAGDVWVSVQSPSANDGSVISLGATPTVILDEDDAGLGGAELDALLFSPSTSPIGRLSFDASTASPGDALTAEFVGGMPNHPLMVLVAGNSGYFSTMGVLTGFDAIYVDLADPWLNMFVPVPVFTLDGNGSFSRPVVLPPGSSGGAGFDGSSGWTFQTIDLITLEVSAPFRIEL